MSMNQDNEDALELFNRLFERLHQADYKSMGSPNVEFVYVASGGQHINTQHIYNTCQHKPPKDDRPRDLPDALNSKSAMALWQKAQRAGYVDNNHQSLLSRSQSALLAEAMATRLGIKEKWKTFEVLWKRKNMYKDYYRAMEQQQSLRFQDKLKQLFA